MRAKFEEEVNKINHPLLKTAKDKYFEILKKFKEDEDPEEPIKLAKMYESLETRIARNAKLTEEKTNYIS